MKKAIILFALIAGTSAIAQNNIDDTIQVVGEGTVATTPDKAVISVSILQEEEEDYKKAQQAVNTVANKLLSDLEHLKIDKKDIRTDLVRLNKTYDYNLKKYKYSATQSFNIVLQDLNKYGEVMNTILASGVNRIDDVKLEVSNSTELENEARKNAIKNAKEKADLYAEAMQVEIIGVKAMQEDEIRNQVNVANYAMMSTSAKTSADPVLSAGTQYVKARVQIVYKIRNK